MVIDFDTRIPHSFLKYYIDIPQNMIPYDMTEWTVEK